MLVELELRSPKTRLEPVLPYAFGLTAVVAATMMALMAQPVFGSVQPYIAYILPVMAAAAYGGLLPGLASTSASTLAIIFVFLHGALDVSSELFLVLFLLDGLCISWLGEQMRDAMRVSQRAQKETLDAHRSQQRILSSISDAFGALDARCRFIYANRNLAAIAGVSPEALVGEEVWTMIPAFCAAGPRQALQQALETRVSTILRNVRAAPESLVRNHGVPVRIRSLPVQPGHHAPPGCRTRASRDGRTPPAGA